MHLSPPDSDSFRRLVRNCLCEAHLPERDLASYVAPSIHQSTLYRLLSTDQPVSLVHADAIVHALQVALLDSGRKPPIVDVSKGHLSLSNSELAIVECVRADRPG